ncbi:hypothetical protein [Longispora urticae]
MTKKRFATVMVATAVGAASLLGGVSSAQASVAGVNADYYCSSGPYTTDNGTRAAATCQSYGRQVKVKAECDWSPWSISSNAFNSNLEYRKTNGSCSNGIESAFIAWV